ncbi:MAG: hypothetical protein U0794_03960 [Isosphaeraceae bacterium]
MVACSANKPQIGHRLGAAGAVELALTALAVRDAFVPPTLNLDDPDPGCDLDATPGASARAYPGRLEALWDFGGHPLRRRRPQARAHRMAARFARGRETRKPHDPLAWIDEEAAARSARGLERAPRMSGVGQNQVDAAQRGDPS